MATEVELERLVIRLVGDVEQYVKAIQLSARETELAAKRTKDAADKVESFTGHLNSAAGAAKGYAQQLAAIAGITGAFGTMTLGVQLAAEAEQMKIAFGTMLQSTAAGEKMVADLQKFAAATPMDLPTLQRATKTLLQFGIEGNEIIETLRMLGDVTGGEAEKFQRMALAFGQMSGTGRLMGEELNQMIEAGFNPLKEMSRTTKKPLGQLREEMEKGLITIDLVREAFKTATSEGGNFAGLMEKQSKSLGGLFSTMKDDVGAFLRTLGEDVIEGLSLKSIVISVSTAAQGLQKWLSGLSYQTKQWAVVIGLVAAAVGSMALAWTVAGGLITGTIGTITTAVTGLGIAMKSLTFANLQATLSALGSIAVHPVTLGILTVVAAWLTLKQATRNIGHDVPIEAFYAGLEDGAKRVAKEVGRLAETTSTFLQDLSTVTDPAKALDFVTQELEKAQKEAKKTEAQLESLKKTLEESQLQHTWLDKVMLWSGLGADVQGDSIRQFIKEQTQLVEAYRDRLDQLRQAQKKLEPTKMAEKLASDISKLTEKLKLQTATAGMSEDAAKIHEIAMKMLGDAHVGAAADAAHFALAERDAAKEAADLDKAVVDLVKSLQEEIALHGKAGHEAKVAALARRGATGVEFEFAKALARTNEELDRQKKLMDEGKQLMDSLRTPTERYQDEIDRLHTMLDSGAISEQAFARGMEKAKEELEKTRDVAAQTAREIQRVDAALAGSAEAEFRLANFREMLKQRPGVRPGEDVAAAIDPAAERMRQFEEMLRDRTSPYFRPDRGHELNPEDSPYFRDARPPAGFDPYAPGPTTPPRRGPYGDTLVGRPGEPYFDMESPYFRSGPPAPSNASIPSQNPYDVKKGNDYLKEIRDILKQDADTQNVVIEAAGFSL